MSPPVIRCADISGQSVLFIAVVRNGALLFMSYGMRSIAIAVEPGVRWCLLVGPVW